MFASSSFEPLYDVGLSWAEADALRTLRGSDVDVLHWAGDPDGEPVWEFGPGWELRLVAGNGVSLAVRPIEVPTPTKGRHLLDVERPQVSPLAEDADGDDDGLLRHPLGRVEEVAVYTTMGWWSPPESEPDGTTSHKWNEVHPQNVAFLERAAREVEAAGFNAGITRLDVCLEVSAARRFGVWTDGFALYWGFDGPPAELLETTERTVLA
jgi:hypothetical protein